MDSAADRKALFFGLLALVLGLTVRLLVPFLPLIAWAVILAVLAWPMHRRLERRLHRPSLAAALSCLLVALAVTLVTLFFLLRDAHRALPALRAFLPLDSEETNALLRRIVDTIHATVYGQTVVAVTQGALGGLAFWAPGLLTPLLWGAVMTVLCLVPLLGAPVVWVPAAITLLARGHYLRALALVLWGCLVIGLVDNFLRPALIGARTRLHPLLVFFCAFRGLLAMGPLGLFLGPVLLAVALALLERVAQRLRGPA